MTPAWVLIDEHLRSGPEFVAVLPPTRLFSNKSVPVVSSMPPPLSLAWLPDTVQEYKRTVLVPSPSMPPPTFAEFPASVHEVRVSTPETCSMAPPSFTAEFPLSVQALRVRVPSFPIPPAFEPDELPERVHLVNVAEPPLSLSMPPPPGHPLAMFPDRTQSVRVSVALSA